MNIGVKILMKKFNKFSLAFYQKDGTLNPWGRGKPHEYKIDLTSKKIIVIPYKNYNKYIKILIYIRKAFGKNQHSFKIKAPTPIPHSFDY